MKKIYIPLGALATFALVACAPIKEDQCRAGNWTAIGIRDGANGRSENFIGKLAEECAKYSITVDSQAWRQGRLEGLKSYCTINNAEEIGRRGREMNPVCGQSPVLAAANDHGEKYHALKEELDELENEAGELKEIINNNFQGELTREQTRLLRRYLRRLDDVEDNIRDIKRDIRRFPSFASTL